MSVDLYNEAIVASYKGGFQLGFLAAGRFIVNGGKLPSKHIEKFLNQMWKAEGLDFEDMGLRKDSP